MLELILKEEIFGSYKDLEIEMRLNNLDTIEIIETRYCFIKVEDYRLLTYKEVKELSALNELEIIKYQSILSKKDNKTRGL